MMRHPPTFRPPGSPPGLPGALPAEALGPRRVEPSAPAALMLRLVLIACFCAALMHTMMMPVERTVGDLLSNLSDGNVETMTIERPPSDLQGQMRLRVDWTQTSGRDGYTYYESSTLLDQPGIDEGETILTAAQGSPSPVDITVRDGMADRSGIIWNAIGLVWIAALFVLIAGRQPRLATKWAWFWLGWAVPVAFLVFLVLEPVPAWRRTAASPRARRLTGGWAFLLALVLGTLWHSRSLAI